MKLNVPYSSQHLHVSEVYWQKRACGMACVKMVLDFLKKDAPILDDLLWQGVRIDGYGPSGWMHNALVSLLDMHGVSAKRKEFKTDELFEAGFREIIRSLLLGLPVVVSAVKKFEETKKFHMVLLTGFEKENGIVTGLYYHDPDGETPEEGTHRFVPYELFKKHWRRLAIFVGKN